MAAKREPVPWLEWASAALGLLVAIVLLAIIGRDALSGAQRQPPDLTAHVQAVTPTAGGFVAEVVVTNGSAETAAAVAIEGTLGDEVSTASIDYVPGRSEARGGLLFTSDPRRGELKLRVTGYQLP